MSFCDCGEPAVCTTVEGTHLCHSCRDAPDRLQPLRAAIESGDKHRIADEMHELDKPSPGFAPALGQWLDGSPMDPAAETPEPLPTVPGVPFMHAGASALIVGPTGAGRSSLVQAVAYDAGRQGSRVAYLGSEVTEAEFNARAALLADKRGDDVDDAMRAQLARVRYLDLATVIAQAWRTPDVWQAEMIARYDIVIIDPLSGVASTLGVDFDKSNAEYIDFYDRLVQPLSTAGLVVLQLDNVGHAIEAKSRAKGASAKQDKADLTFACKVKAAPIGLIITAGKVRSARAPFARGDSWVFDRDAQRIIVEAAASTGASDPAAWRPTVLMGRVSDAVVATPGISRTAIRNTVQGKSQTVAVALDLLITDGYVEHRDNGHYSARSYVAPNDDTAIDVPGRSRQCPRANEGNGALGSPHSSAVPGPFPIGVGGPVPAVPPSNEVTGNGNRNDPLDQARLDDLATRHPEAA